MEHAELSHDEAADHDGCTAMSPCQLYRPTAGTYTELSDSRNIVRKPLGHVQTLRKFDCGQCNSSMTNRSVGQQHVAVSTSLVLECISHQVIEPCILLGEVNSRQVE